MTNDLLLQSRGREMNQENRHSESTAEGGQLDVDVDRITLRRVRRADVSEEGQK